MRAPMVPPGVNLRGVQAVGVTVLFLVVTWLAVRQPVKEGKRSCQVLGDEVKGFVYNKSSVVLVDGTDTQEYGKLEGPLSCGKKVWKDVSVAQGTILKNVAEVKVLLDSLNVTYWVDKRSLESILQKDDSGVATGYFHKADTSLYIGLLHSDAPKLYKAFLTMADVRKITQDHTIESASDLEILVKDVELTGAVHRWNTSKAVVVLGRPSDTAAHFMKVYDVQNGAVISVSTYSLAEGEVTTPTMYNAKTGTEASHTFTADNVFPIQKCKMYEVAYPCPAHPSYYLDELGGGSWLFRSKASRVKWVVVIALFVFLAHWVMKRV